MDFYKITTIFPKKGVVEIYPDFMVKPSKDLMIRGKSFYAIWDEEIGMWSTNPLDVPRLIDKELDDYYEAHKEELSEGNVSIKYLRNNRTGMWKTFVEYLRNMPDNYHQLDTKVVFSNSETTRKDYVSKKLSYPLEKGSTKNYDEMVSLLYSPEERAKFEWLIGSIISGDSKTIQKFFVFYGGPGTGKSTIIDIIQALFEGYWSVIDVKSLGSNNNLFATEMLKANPLLAIQHDGDLSRIEDNSKLNSIVSHENITVNEKFKAQYDIKPITTLVMGTNSPVKITDEKSGIKRRLIDINPTGLTHEKRKYDDLKEKILNFELPGIAYHCLEVYEEMGKNYYKHYEPTEMQYMTDFFMNFVEENYILFKKQDYTYLSQAYDLYKQYVDDAGLPYKISKQEVRAKLKDYFDIFEEDKRITINNEERHMRSFYSGFKAEKFERHVLKHDKEEKQKSWIDFKEQKSIFDILMKDFPAQYANKEETPTCKWEKCKTKLSDLDTSKLHYVMVPENHIVIDFDLKDANGNKSYEKNLEQASKWPETYAELSKSGAGIHLHYIYTGDVNELSRIYDKDIEIKVFTGNSSLRRKLTKCNDKDVATISSGLPFKETKGANVVNWKIIEDEKHLRSLIIKSLKKKVHPNTKPNIDFIYSLLEDSYKRGIKYDVTDMYPDISAFATNSTHNADYCMEVVAKMKFKSEEDFEGNENYDDERITFYDIEVFPNLLLVNWKYEGENNPVVRMINPSSEEIGELMKHKLVGFNCRRYDNHLIYARYLGCDNKDIYERSQRIINDSQNGFYSEAYNLSYTDIYDYSTDKKSLKKWEIELGIHHQELGMAWDQDVPEFLWEKVAEYCDNDVIATEAVWNATKSDFLARQILVSICKHNGQKATVNDTTNSLTTKIIFGNERHPQLVYTDLATGEQTPDLGKTNNYIMAFPGYEYVNGKNMYKGVDVSRGGYVYAEPSMQTLTKTFDVAGEHPASIIALNHFGKYTKNYKDLVDARLAIKHKEYDKAAKMLNGALAPYLGNPEDAKQLSKALKIPINAVYGLTSASFENPFKDIRNKNNIVALRGALFMVNLKEEVEKRGFKVLHIKTDSIKIPHPTKEIEEFIFDYGKKYGYTFEVEHIFEKICLVNNAVYIAKLDVTDPEWIDACNKAKEKGLPEPTRWTATGAQFQVPYVFKKLFSHEEITFDDMCEVKAVQSSMYLDMNENLPDVSMYEKELKDRTSAKNELMYKNPQLQSVTNDELKELIAKGHEYNFIGKVGLFCPMKPGTGGGILYSSKEPGKYDCVTGTKGYRWMEAEVVRALGKEGDVDVTYYEDLCKEAIKTINKFGDFEQFVSDEYAEIPFDNSIIINKGE